MKNILAVIAHPDYLEIMAGGAVITWIRNGLNVHVLCLSDGSFASENNILCRSKEDAEYEALQSSRYIGFTYENLGHRCLNLNYSDEIVVEVKNRINKYLIDSILCPYDKDLHHDHRVASRIALSAGRRLPNILMGQINYFMRELFAPNFFVDISGVWDEKIQACEIYKSQWKNDWFEFLDITSRYYGKICGVYRAEGFISLKYVAQT